MTCMIDDRNVHDKALKKQQGGVYLAVRILKHGLLTRWVCGDDPTAVVHSEPLHSGRREVWGRVGGGNPPLNAHPLPLAHA